MHLLAIDDDPIILEILKALIDQMDDHTVDTAGCAAEALDYLAREDTEQVDAMVIDQAMSGLDGADLCRIIRSRSDHADTPVLMLCAHPDRQRVDEAFAAGATDCLEKPFDFRSFHNRIDMFDRLIAYRSEQVQRDEKPALHAPVAIRDVDGVIDQLALENYVCLLVQSGQMGASVFALTIKDMPGLYARSSGFEHTCLITDVAEAISSNVRNHQFLMSHVGNGAFICVAEPGWPADPHALASRVSHTLDKMELCFNDGSEIDVVLSAGQTSRLVHPSAERAIEALAEAYQSAEREMQNTPGHADDHWSDLRSA